MTVKLQDDVSLVKHYNTTLTRAVAPNLESKGFRVINSSENNFKAADDIIIVRSGSIFKRLWLNVDETYDHQIRAAKIPKNSNSIETVRSRDYHVHQLNSLNLKQLFDNFRKSFKQWKMLLSAVLISRKHSRPSPFFLKRNSPQTFSWKFPWNFKQKNLWIPASKASNYLKSTGLHF